MPPVIHHSCIYSYFLVKTVQEHEKYFTRCLITAVAQLPPQRDKVVDSVSLEIQQIKFHKTDELESVSIKFRGG